jgi:hypothetical protein
MFPFDTALPPLSPQEPGIRPPPDFDGKTLTAEVWLQKVKLYINNKPSEFTKGEKDKIAFATCTGNIIITFPLKNVRT